MTINMERDGGKLCVSLEGRLDTSTAPELDAKLKTELKGVTELVFDLKALDYVSSAGLRSLLTAQKVMNKQGSMEIHNAREMIMEVFEVTGFVDILTIV